MLLSAHNAEELYARSDLSEPFLGKIAKKEEARGAFLKPTKADTWRMCSTI